MTDEPNPVLPPVTNLASNDATDDGLALKRVSTPAGPVNQVKATEEYFRTLGGSGSHKFNNDLFRSALATVWTVGGEDRAEVEARKIAAVAAALSAFKPADEIEGMLAAQAVAMHQASMECFRRAMLREQTAEHSTKLRKDGANMARGMADMLEALDRKRGKGPQVVRVERVVVHEGGQAIVGTVQAGGRGNQ